MEMNQEQEIEFKKITDLVIKYMNDNGTLYDPYTQLIFDTISVTVTVPIKRLMTHEFLHD